MSDKSWRSKVRAAAQQRGASPQIAVVGIGHELRGDDAAGIAVVRLLTGRENFLVIEAGAAPENHAHKLRRFQPDVVLLIDAAQMNLAPGEIAAFDLSAVGGLSASTHTMPLTLFAHYITTELGCDVLLIGIQPENNAVGAALTPQIQHAVRTLSRALLSDFGSI